MHGSRIRYADAAIDDIASILVASDPAAADYLAQVPILALVTCQKFGGNITYGEVDRFKAVIAGRPRLRDLMNAYGLSNPARKISHTALRNKDRSTVRELLRIDPSSLSQCIPDAADQRLWLDGIGQWLRLMPSGKRERQKFSVLWIARQLSLAPTRCSQVHSLVDFVARSGTPINERWSWDKALAETVAWHNRLNDQRAIARMLQDEKQRARLETVICKAPIPDLATVDGFDFVALRTGRALQEEGEALHHCVASYAGQVKSGRSAIVSIRRDGVNIATLEIDEKGVPVQLKAHCNQTPSAMVRTAAERFALSHWRPHKKDAASTEHAAPGVSHTERG